MYAIVRGEMKGVGKLSVDGMAGKVLSRSAETVLRLDGAMAKKARPWLLDSFSKRWANRTLKSCSPWSSAKRGTLTGVLPLKRQTWSAKSDASDIRVYTTHIQVYPNIPTINQYILVYTIT